MALASCPRPLVQRLSRTIALVGAFVVSGCSFLLSEPREPSSPEDPPGCSTSDVAPAMDAIGAVVFGIAGTVALHRGHAAAQCAPADCNEGSDDEFGRIVTDIGILLMIPTAVYGVAAGTGYYRTSRCRDAHERHAAWQAAHAR